MSPSRPLSRQWRLAAAQLTRVLALALLLLAASACEEQAGHEGHAHPEPAGGPRAGVVALGSAQLARAGVTLGTVAPGRVQERLRLTAVVEPNLDAQVHLTPKVPGLVRSIRKGLGDRVEAGEVLCELESTELGAAASRYLVASASLEVARERLEQERALLERGVEVAAKVFARESRLKEQAITTMRPYYEAEIALAQARLKRDRRVLELAGEVRQAEIQVHAADEALKILGFDAAGIAALAKDEEHGHGRYPLRAPGGGVIVARDISENEHVETSSKLFVIEDLSTVWVVASVYEGDLRRVARGQAAEVRLAAFPGRVFRGEVALVGYQVDPRSRACEVRVTLPNRALPGWNEPFPIRPGMFGEVDLVLAEREAARVIPETALVHEGEANYVYVALEAHGDEGHGGEEHAEEGHAEHEEHEGEEHEGEEHEGEEHGDHAGHVEAGPARRFERRRVEVGIQSGDRVEILSGLVAGERVVVTGAFTLESVARSGELGGGHSH